MNAPPLLTALACREVAPLWSMSAAMAWLRKNHEDILDLVDEGQLEWVWDIASPGACRREIRIWFRSLEAYKARLKACAGATDLGRPLGRAGQRAPTGLLPELDLDTVLGLVIGHSRPTLRGGEVRGLLSCDRNLVAKLLVHNELTALNVDPATGRVIGNVSPVIPRVSLLAFLRRRRIT